MASSPDGLQPPEIMSLIRVRKIRKKNWLGARKGMSAGRLLVLLVLTVAVIWYLGWRF